MLCCNCLLYTLSIENVMVGGLSLSTPKEGHHAPQAIRILLTQYCDLIYYELMFYCDRPLPSLYYLQSKSIELAMIDPCVIKLLMYRLYIMKCMKVHYTTHVLW